MSCASIWAGVVSGIPAGIVTLAVGIAGWIIARNQAATARAKLKLDLFEKRYPIFLETWKIMSEVAREGTRKKNWGLSTPFNNFIPQARFLFGKDVEAYLSNAVKQWTDLYAVEAESEDPAERVKNVARRRDLTNWFFDQASTGVKDLFAPYLDFEKWR